VDKVLAYHTPAAFGPWRTHLDFVADDEDQNLHLQDAEVISGTAAATEPLFNPRKIYLDAFQQESGSAGGRYPSANAAINSNIYSGTLLWNYSGHGGPQRLAEEVVLDQSIVNNWNNPTGCHFLLRPPAILHRTIIRWSFAWRKPFGASKTGLLP
jgi:hypothetical protein